jgi:hypothetical protein
MSVVAFPRRKSTARGAGWRDDELRALVAAFDASQARSWDVGATERGDPQFYLLGPAPDHDCLFCVSRLAHGYVLEDGAGRILGEAPALHLLAEEARRAIARAGRSFVARATLLLCAIRLTIEEKLEPVIEEAQELLTRLAPQIAALA